MKVLVTGNNGYIGSVLTEMLVKKGYEVTGLDTDYYAECRLYDSGIDKMIEQIRKDVRNISAEDLKGFDGVIHLAALSNDPLGEFNKKLTEDINFSGTVAICRLAKEAKVRRFVYASSQSMYGISGEDKELDEDASEKNPLTAYAKTKWEAELEIKKLGDKDFTVSCLRPSTVFGASPSLRCDIVFNNLVACAYTTGRIEIKSDGTPWRPVVHVKDVCSAFIAGLEAPDELVSGRSFNVGIKSGNFTVRDLAEAAQKAVKGSSLVFTGEHNKDSRTYRVSFDRILNELKDFYKPEWDLIKGGEELVRLFEKVDFNEEMFRGRKYNRLAQLKHLVEKKEIDENLFWMKSMGFT